MNTLAKFLAPLALTGTILPPLLFLFRAIGEGPMKLTMLAAAILWFATAPWVLKGGGAGNQSSPVRPASASRVAPATRKAKG